MIIVLIYLFKYTLYLMFKILIKYCYAHLCFINKLRALSPRSHNRVSTLEPLMKSTPKYVLKTQDL